MREKSNKIARYIFNNDSNEEKIELYGFAIYIVNSSLLHIGTLLVIGWLFGMVVESVIFYVSFIAIRKFAGGYHAMTPLRCYLFSTITIFISLLLLQQLSNFSKAITYVFIFIELISIICIIVLSPLDSGNKPISNKKEKKVYKIISSINSITLFLVSLCMLNLNEQYGLSIMLGLFLSAAVLLMRATQIKNHN